MAGTQFFQRADRAIDLGTCFYVDNQIAKKHYDAFIAGFNGDAFKGREYSDLYLAHAYGARIRAKVESGEMVVSKLPHMAGRIINADVEIALTRCHCEAT